MRIAVAWHGLPISACRILREFKRLHNTDHIDVIAELEKTPYEKRSEHLASYFLEVGRKPIQWCQLGTKVPDVMFTMSWWHPCYNSLAHEVRKNGGKVILMLDNIFTGSLRQWIGAGVFRVNLIHKFDAVFVPGKASFSFLRFLGMPADRIWTGLYCGDPEIFSADPHQHRCNEFVFVGQFIERKGIRELVRALKAERLLGEAVFVGAGELETWMRDNGCKMIPFLQTPQLAEILRSSKVMILPSRLDHWGIAMHEAALARCLLVGTRTTGASHDLIENGVNGFIVRENCEEELRSVIRKLKTFTEKQRVEGEAVSGQKAAQFSPTIWSQRADEIIEIVRHA